MEKKNDGIIMLLDAVYFNGKKIGLITDEGLDWGGDAAEYIKVFAAQVRNAPVKKLKTKEATNVFTFQMFELTPQNCADILGGEVVDGRWNAPAETVSAEGPLTIVCGTGQTVEVGNVSFSGEVRGGLGGEKKLGIDCSVEMLSPLDGGSPYNIGVAVPSIKIGPTALEFDADGGEKTAIIEASGQFRIGTVPEGFVVEVDRKGVVTVTAATNTGAQKTGTIEFSLVDGSQKCSIQLTQTAGV